MKKRMAVIVALIIGIGIWPSEIVAMAEEADVENKSTDCLLEDYLDKNTLEIKEGDISSNSKDLLGIGENNSFNQPRKMFVVKEKDTVEEETEAENDKEYEGKDREKLVGEKESVSDEAVASAMKNLLIPQKLDIVIDPWEMDGRGQIYSEKYVIRNEGETTGILTLSNLTCKSQESGNVIVRSDKNGLHDDEEKALYLEMWFGDSDCIVLSEQGAEYQTELEPGEEIIIYFAGEVNEYASEDWGSNDVKVSIVYSWDVEEALTDEKVEDKSAAEIKENANELKGESEDADTKDKEETDGLDNNIVKTENFEEASDNREVGESKDLDENGESKEPMGDEINSEDNLQKEVEISKEENIFYIAEEMQTGDGSVQEDTKEDRTKVIELSERQETKAVVDFWKIGPDHQITSAKYVIRNVGEKTGIFSLTDLVCQPKEESGIYVKTVQEEVKDADEKAIYLEMILGNGDKVVLSQTKSEYRVELKPREEMAVQFVGVMNVDMSGDGEENSVVIETRCSWNVV